MPDLADGDSIEMAGSGATPYVLKNDGGVYSCSCPAWRHQSLPIDRRTCKHLRRLRGDQAELDRVGAELPPVPAGRTARPSGGGGSKASGDAKGPPVLLAEKWDPSEHDPTGWWASEKLDGVRAYWDGAQFLSRLGNRFYAPAWFVEGLPDHPLDGELWGGRKQFQDTVSTVRRADGGGRWKELAFVVFDAPDHGGPFEARKDAVDALLGPGAHPYARALEHVRCAGIAHLREELARVEGLGGEGLMLRRPGSKYEVGRSSSLLKVKNFFDAEGIVIGHVPGTGKHKGRLGSLLVEMEGGVRFNVGTGFSDAERGDPPPVGELITFRYQELTKAGVPRFPSFVGVRIDGERPAARVAAPRPPRAPYAPPVVARPVVAPTARVSAGDAEGEGEGEGEGDEQEVAVGRGRRFEFEEGTSSKFWEIVQDGGTFTVTYGRIGSSGQSKAKDMGSASNAAAEVAKLIAEKTRKGYTEVTAGGSAPAAPASAPKAAPKAAAPKAPAAPKAAAPKAAPKAAPAPSGGGGTRRFEYVDDGSSKYWEVTQEGSAFTVTYGRIGSGGQTKTKDTASPAAAAAEVSKLIAEKTGKGYVEVGGAGAPVAAPPPADVDDDDSDGDDGDDDDVPTTRAPARAPAARAPAAPAAPAGAAPLTADAARAVLAEVRPMLATAKTRLSKAYPKGLPAGPLAALGLDGEDTAALNRLVHELGEAVQILARLE